MLQIVLLGQPELRELLQRRTLRQLAQRITARYHLSPLGPKDTHLYIRHRMQVAGAQRNPFRRSAMNALYQRSQGIPRLINIIADRSLIAAFAKERMDVTAAMVHEAANEVQLGERQVKRLRWPWVLGTTAMAAVAIIAVAWFSDFRVPSNADDIQTVNVVPPPIQEALPQTVETASVAEEPQPEAIEPEVLASLDTVWLEDHQLRVWQGLAELWSQPVAAFSIQAACNGDNSLGYACLRDQGSWAKITRLGLPVVLELQGESQAYLLLQGIDGERLLIGSAGHLKTVSRVSVESRWFGAYQVAWPQAPGWPPLIGKGDAGPAVATIMDMATMVDVPYDGDKVFDDAFELWLKGFQMRNGLEADGIVGRNTLLHLMTASIKEPQLLRTWE